MAYNRTVTDVSNDVCKICRLITEFSVPQSILICTDVRSVYMCVCSRVPRMLKCMQPA